MVFKQIYAAPLSMPVVHVSRQYIQIVYGVFFEQEEKIDKVWTSANDYNIVPKLTWTALTWVYDDNA
jgi:hypothetical protein